MWDEGSDIAIYEFLSIEETLLRSLSWANQMARG